LGLRQNASNLEHGKRIPSFVSGYVEGKPIYTIVRVVPQEIVAGIEEDRLTVRRLLFIQKSGEPNL
jgi:hypothetical protein